MPLSAERIADAHLMEADGIVYLYKITLVSGPVIRVKADDTVSWNNNSWEGTAVQLDQRGVNSDGQKVRPKLTIANPVAAYSAQVAQHLLDNALVNEIQVLRSDIIAHNIIFTEQTWRIRKIISLTRVSLAVELRDIGDGQRYILPARSYTPPTFPSVSL